MTELTKRQLSEENLVKLQFCYYTETDECVYTDFSVSKIWLLEYLDIKVSELSEFLDTWTSEETRNVYETAVLEEAICDVSYSDSIYKKDNIQHVLKNTTQTFPITTSVSIETLENIVVTALEGGIGYWAVLDTTTKKWKKYDYCDLPCSQAAFELLYNGNSLRFYDVEDETEVWRLTWKNLIKGVEMFGGVKEEDIDATVAEKIIQYALFGKIIFG
jgi:hypothetical protein